MSRSLQFVVKYRRMPCFLVRMSVVLFIYPLSWGFFRPNQFARDGDQSTAAQERCCMTSHLWENTDGLQEKMERSSIRPTKDTRGLHRQAERLRLFILSVSSIPSMDGL